MTVKKTFYQILDIRAGATSDDIQAAYEQQMLKLRAQAAGISFEEFEYRRKLLDLAHTTLSDPEAHRDYDDRLMSRTPAVPPTPAAGDTLARRAEALAIRADAMALRADAMSLTTDASLVRFESQPPSFGSRLAMGMKSSLRTVAIIMGTLAATAFLFQTAAVFFTVRKAGETTSAAAKAEEQMVIEEYYRQHGIRPASAAEARMLERENQRREREAREAERDTQRQESEARRKEEEDRRYAAQISSDLRHAEADVAREEAMEKRKQELEERRREEEEKRRIRQQEREWRAIMRR